MSKAREYQQVAAIVSMDIDILAKIAERDEWTADELKVFIFRLKQQKDLAITDAENREMRYNAMSDVFNIASRQ